METMGVLVYHPMEVPEPGPVQEQRDNMTVIHVDRLMKVNPNEIDFVVYGDRYSCDCGNTVITGFGKRILYNGGNQEMLKRMVSKSKDAVEIRRR